LFNNNGRECDSIRLGIILDIYHSLVAQVASRVRAIVEDIDCGFKIFIGEIPVRGFLATGSPMKEAVRISLTSLPDNSACSRSCGNVFNVLGLHSKGCASSSTSKSDDVCIFEFFSIEPELDPTSSPHAFLFRSSRGKR
jgi:hypothetical protein